MRTIQKQISLEPMTSRLPSVWPAYYNNVYYYFDDNSLKEREWKYTSNWGMVPVNIVVNHNPNELGDDGRPQLYSAYSAVEGCHCYGNSMPYDELCNFVLSFENLSKWYYFFNEYYNLLKQYSHCDRVYTSAEDYYNYESLDKYADQMIYGTEKQTYLDLDKEFAEKGGRVTVKVFDKETAQYKWVDPQTAHDEPRPDNSGMVDVADEGFFKWICDNVVPSFKIPMEYVDYWKKDTLFYPDVIKWLAWFGERLHYEDDAKFEEGKGGEVDSWNCKESAVTENGDCCDCEEYFNRGGKRTFNLMKDWYNKIQGTINGNNAKMPKDGTCYIPTVIMPTELQVSIDDLGQFSIFSTDYELCNDYRTIRTEGSKIYYEDGNTHSGTVVTMDDESMILSRDSYTNPSGMGFVFEEEYMEKYASSCKTCGYEGVFVNVCPKCGSREIDTIDWKSYTDFYIENNRDEFDVNSDFKYYAFDDHNVKYSGSSSGDVITNMTKHFPITKRENGWMLIEGELYPIKEIEYAIYDTRNRYLGGKKYMVYREKGTNTPYTIINGKKIFAEFYPPRGVFYFPFFPKASAQFKVECSGRIFNIDNYEPFYRDSSSSTMYYIEYKGSTYEVTASTMVIDGIDSYAVTGHAMSDKNETLYCISGGSDVWYDNDGLVEYPNATANTKTVDVVLGEDDVKKVIMYNADEVRGRTVSKIYDLRLYNVLTDDIGNTIESIYDLKNKYNHQPPEGTELDLIYQVGNTANITRFSHTKEDLDDIKNGRNYFVGDIITNMNFYYKNYSDEMEEDTLYNVTLKPDDTIEISGKTRSKSINSKSGYTSLSAITWATEDKKNKLDPKGKLCQDDIYCDITYYKGATLSRKENENYNLASSGRGDSYVASDGSTRYYQNYGVEYKETVRFVKTNAEYYLKKPTDEETILPTNRENPCKHSVSYPVWIYVLTQDMTRVDESQYDSEYSVALADFKFDINIFSGNSDTFYEKYREEMAKHNNLQVYPVFREEYGFGSSIIENVDSDIYIDRGINAAYEKHLKLGEVTSLEALEQYGNGYFKIMES